MTAAYSSWMVRASESGSVLDWILGVYVAAVVILFLAGGFRQ